MADLNMPFELDVLDDALAPEICKGYVARFDPRRKPEAGRPVLVRDRSGAHYIRRFQPAGRGTWVALAAQAGHRSLCSDADGLTLVAPMMGFDWPAQVAASAGNR